MRREEDDMKLVSREKYRVKLEGEVKLVREVKLVQKGPRGCGGGGAKGVMTLHPSGNLSSQIFIKKYESEIRATCPRLGITSMQRPTHQNIIQ